MMEIMLYCSDIPQKSIAHIHKTLYFLVRLHHFQGYQFICPPTLEIISGSGKFEPVSITTPVLTVMPLLLRLLGFPAEYFLLFPAPFPDHRRRIFVGPIPVAARLFFLA